MSMKALVNTPDIHSSFMEYLDSKIRVLQTSLEQATQVESVYRLQGQITALRKLKNIRDEINYREKSYG